MPKPRSGRHTRFQTGQDRNTAQVRGNKLPRARKAQAGPMTVRLIEYLPPLDSPVDLGTERIWDASRA